MKGDAGSKWGPKRKRGAQKGRAKMEAKKKRGEKKGFQ